MLTDVETFFDEQKLVVAKYIDSNFTRVNAAQLGLDSRAGYCLYVNDEAVAVSTKDVMLLDYYAGFEYVDSSSRHESCGFVFYTHDDNRVRNCIKHWQTVDSTLEIA